MTARKIGPLIALTLGPWLGCSPPPAEVCFEVLSLDRPLLCGLDGQAQQDLVPGGSPSFASACYAEAECPSACPASELMDSTIVPEFLEANPNFTMNSAAPLCREDDPDTGECCYWVVLDGTYASTP